MGSDSTVLRHGLTRYRRSYLCPLALTLTGTNPWRLYGRLLLARGDLALPNDSSTAGWFEWSRVSVSGPRTSHEILLFLVCLPALALSNAVTINNLAATAQTARTWAVHRYFADKEICGQPQPFTGGSAITDWQADVTSRWAADGVCSGGYAKTAMISFEATVAGSSSLVVEFRASTNSCNLGDAATCTAAGATRDQLLAFDTGGGAGSWGLKVTATAGGITLSRSARTMLAADQYQILKNGPLFTEVLVREGPQSVQGTSTRATSFGWKCLTNCTALYDTATWQDNAAWYSIRPTFLLRFYRRWGRVEGDSVLQNAWMDRHVDQRFDSYAVMHGAGEATSCYTAPAAVVFPARATIWDGPCGRRSMVPVTPG